MRTKKVNTMPDSSNDDAVKTNTQLTEDDDYFKAHPHVLSPSLYVGEEKRLAGLESADNEDDSSTPKKKKKKKKNRKNHPIEGVLDAIHSKNNKKQSSVVNDQSTTSNADDADKKQSRKRKRQNDSVGDHDDTNQSPKRSKKQKSQKDNTDDLEVKPDIITVSKHSKKRREQNNNGTEKNMNDVIKEEDGNHPQQQKKQNGNMNGLKSNHVDDIDEKPPKTQMGPDVKPPMGQVYKHGMSLDEAIQAKHDAKNKSKTSKWRKNRPVEKEVNRRKSRLEEKLKQLKAKCEALQALKNSGESVMRREKRLMSKERKLSSELGVISGSKKERKRKLLERRMTLAEGLRSPNHSTPSILNSNGAPVKSKFDFSIFSVGDDKSRTTSLHGRDYKRLLQVVEKRKDEVEEMKEKDAEKGRKYEEKMAWQMMMSRARGEKVKDDPKLLKRAIKRADKMKDKRKRKWEERVAKVEESKEMRQRKRQANLDKRKQDKQDKKRKKAIKKGRYIPGFG